MKKIATRDSYGEVLAEIGGENPNLVVLDADLSKSTKTAVFGSRYPERFFNMGIAEQNMMGTAAGLAAAGKIPFVSSFAVFAAGRAFDQVRNAIAYPALNVKIVASHAGITVGEDGASHQSVEDVALMRSLPNMTVIVPADAVEVKHAVKAAAQHVGPVYIRLGRPKVPVVMPEDYGFRIGSAVWLRRGRDVALIACGIMVSACLEAASLLQASGVEASVVNMHTIKPLDVDAVVEAASSCGALVTAEEHTIIGGLGSAVAEAVVEHIPVPVERVGIRDRFGVSGSPEELLREYGLTAGDVVRAALKAIRRKKEG